MQAFNTEIYVIHRGEETITVPTVRRNSEKETGHGDDASINEGRGILRDIKRQNNCRECGEREDPGKGQPT